ncbi:phosphatase PAP2 family protein [Streptomyces sp. NPDC057555]|uniref:phosphatase PAP2 family protein n=1 Tax=Streptomyces sp. NPDC057555 TaxID=3346166 RepID=UPI0036B12AE6
MRGRFFGRLGGDRGRGGPAGARACRRYGPVVLCSALVFGWAGWQVTVRGAVRGFDERLGREVAAGGVPGPLAQFFADLGNTVVALPVLVAVAGWVWWRLRRGTGDGPGGTDGTDGSGDGVRAWLPPVAALGTLAAVPALVVPFKVWLDRPGPPRMAGVHEGFFPSGHGATAAVAYGLVALLLIRAYAVRHGRRTVRRRGTAAAPAARVVAAGAGLLNVGVGLGLVRQGYHWPLDVLGGWCLAGVLLPLWCVVCERWGVRTGGGDPEPADRPDMP